MNIDEQSNRSYFITLFLLIFLGYLGAHRFYAGKYLTGIIWLFTGGLFTVGYIFDLILFFSFNFRDDRNKIIIP